MMFNVLGGSARLFLLFEYGSVLYSSRAPHARRPPSHSRHRSSSLGPVGPPALFFGFPFSCRRVLFHVYGLRPFYGMRSHHAALVRVCWARPECRGEREQSRRRSKEWKGPDWMSFRQALDGKAREGGGWLDPRQGCLVSTFGSARAGGRGACSCSLSHSGGVFLLTCVGGGNGLRRILPERGRAPALVVWYLGRNGRVSNLFSLTWNANTDGQHVGVVSVAVSVTGPCLLAGSRADAQRRNISIFLSAYHFFSLLFVIVVLMVGGLCRSLWRGIICIRARVAET